MRLAEQSNEALIRMIDDDEVKALERRIKKLQGV